MELYDFWRIWLHALINNDNYDEENKGAYWAWRAIMTGEHLI